MRPRVVVYTDLPPEQRARLAERFDLTCFDAVDDGNREAFLAALGDADGMIGASVRIDSGVLARAPKLRAAATVSVGFDSFDLETLRVRRVPLCHTPGVLTDTVADLVLALMLAAARRVVELNDMMKAGRWTDSVGPEWFGVDVHHRTLGLVGMGRIGQAVARRAHLGFGMDVVYHNTRPVPEADAVLGARRLPLDAVLATADFVVVLLPLRPGNVRIIDAAKLALMKPSAIFINAARGKVVDEAALIAALENRTIRAAGLDVFETEPLPSESPLLRLPNVVALPHVGSATRATREAMAELAVDGLIDALEGRRPACLADPGVWPEGECLK